MVMDVEEQTDLRFEFSEGAESWLYRCHSAKKGFRRSWVKMDRPNK